MKQIGCVQHDCNECRLNQEELRRLHKVEEAYNAWHEKTEWVQDTSQPCELGMHRADILKRRIDRLHAEHHDLGQALARAIERNNELEAELAEQARLNGMGSEREARLMAVNAELVEALKHAAECVQSNYLPDGMGHDWDDVIAKAEASNG